MAFKINFLYHENYPKLLGIWFFKDFQGAEFLGPNHFQEGVLKGKFSSGREGALASKFNYDFK